MTNSTFGQSVLARPYPHQVGGHGELAVTNSGHVLKPLQPKEYEFYKYIHSDEFPVRLRWIHNFTPKFYGEADFPNMASPRCRPASSSSSHIPTSATLLDNEYSRLPPTNLRSSSTAMAPPASLAEHGNVASENFASVSTSALPASSVSLGDVNSAPASSSTVVSIPSASAALEPDALSGCCIANTEIVVWTPSSGTNCNDGGVASDDLITFSNSATPRWRLSNDAAYTEVNVSPWVSQMRLRTRLSSSSNPLRKPRRSIALEDINKKFVLPCVLDCKIGTRHYDDDASAEKRRRHIEKARATTSAKCGVRYTGMQSFKRSTPGGTNGFFEFRDKYDGRKLKEHDLIPEATWFFHDNFQVRIDCVRPILDRLCELKHYLLSQNHFYFYSSSLLLVYEGAPNDVAPSRFDVRMIDFAHTVLSNGNRDDGYLLGISYLICILKSILSNERDGSRHLPSRAKPHDVTNGTNNHIEYIPSTTSTQQASSPRSKQQDCPDQHEERTRVQVKGSQRPLLSLHKSIQKEVPTTTCHNDVLHNDILP